MPEIYFHIDVNSAFLSWTAIRLLAEGESVDIRTIPSAIGGDMSKRRGVILAKSIPAKAFGVTTGEPITDALKNVRPSVPFSQTTNIITNAATGC